MSNKVIRCCTIGYEYCDGCCDKCYKTRFYTTNEIKDDVQKYLDMIEIVGDEIPSDVNTTNAM